MDGPDKFLLSVGTKITHSVSRVTSSYRVPTITMKVHGRQARYPLDFWPVSREAEHKKVCVCVGEIICFLLTDVLHTPRMFETHKMSERSSFQLKYLWCCSQQYQGITSTLKQNLCSSNVLRLRRRLKSNKGRFKLPVPHAVTALAIAGSLQIQETTAV
jgi:hypothetical protein